MTLLINGLSSSLKLAVLQHLPVQNVDQLINKTRHTESALKAQTPVTLLNYNIKLAQMTLNDPPSEMKRDIKTLQSTHWLKRLMNCRESLLTAAIEDREMKILHLNLKL